VSQTQYHAPPEDETLAHVRFSATFESKQLPQLSAKVFPSVSFLAIAFVYPSAHERANVGARAACRVLT
jgi:hypothetical protein